MEQHVPSTMKERKGGAKKEGRDNHEIKKEVPWKALDESMIARIK